MSSSSSNSGDDSDIELLNDLQTNSDSDVMETAAAAAMPLAQVDDLNLTSTTSSNFNNFGDDNNGKMMNRRSL